MKVKCPQCQHEWSAGTKHAAGRHDPTIRTRCGMSALPGRTGRSSIIEITAVPEEVNCRLCLRVLAKEAELDQFRSKKAGDE